MPLSNSDAGDGDTSAFDWNQVDVLSLIVEREDLDDGISNPDSGNFLVDNLVLVDVDGEYPDLNAMSDEHGDLDPAHQRGFLDLVRATSFLYFLDFASTDPDSGGIIQDRSASIRILRIASGERPPIWTRLGGGKRRCLALPCGRPSGKTGCAEPRRALFDVAPVRRAKRLAGGPVGGPVWAGGPAATRTSPATASRKIAPPPSSHRPVEPDNCVAPSALAAFAM